MTHAVPVKPSSVPDDTELWLINCTDKQFWKHIKKLKML